MTDLTVVRCRTCRRRLAVVAGRSYPTWCDEVCAYDLPVAKTEDRDALIQAVSLETGKNSRVLGEEFDLTRQRVDTILSNRRELLAA